MVVLMNTNKKSQGSEVIERQNSRWNLGAIEFYKCMHCIMEVSQCPLVRHRGE
jgi:succinate dehydrogenase/fumarate reductase-like Fe-S protein